MARNGVDFRDVMIAYMLNPTCGDLEALRKKKNVKQETFQRALTHLVEQVESDPNCQLGPEDLVPFQQWMLDSFDLVEVSEEGSETETEEGPGRGRPAPQVGTEREYKVQRVGGLPFIRLPLNALDCRKGSRVRVRFDDGELRVSKAS